MKDSRTQNPGIWEMTGEEKLLELASQSDAPVPEELGEKLEQLVCSLEAGERLRRERARRTTRLASAAAATAAAASIAAAVAIFETAPRRPADTFSSPEEALAMLERTFAHISEKTSEATDALAGGLSAIEENITGIYR